MYVVTLFTRKWRLPKERWYFPNSEDGLRRAREKCAEIMARYLDNEVKLESYANE